jgi:hypothetical protein
MKRGGIAVKGLWARRFFGNRAMPPKSNILFPEGMRKSGLHAHKACEPLYMAVHFKKGLHEKGLGDISGRRHAESLLIAAFRLFYNPGKNLLGKRRRIWHRIDAS